ncbi:MAG: hypothetical protein ACOCVF_02510 [bacterium]
MKKNYGIHNIHPVEGDTINNNNDAVERFISVIFDIIADVISTNYNDKQIIEKLLKNYMRKDISDMLKEYDNVVAEKILDDVKLFLSKEIDTLNNTKVDYDYTTHAKLDTAIKIIKNHLGSIEDVDKQKQELINDLNSMEMNLASKHQTDLNEIFREFFKDNKAFFTHKQESVIFTTINMYFNKIQGVQAN